jgi:hypothetical protein
MEATTAMIALKADTVSPMAITDKADFKAKVRARQLQNDPEEIRSFYQTPSLKNAS